MLNERLHWQDGAAIVLMLVAIARPAAIVTLPSQHETVILSMDVSGSMRATDVEPNRLVAAQNAAKASELVQVMRKAGKPLLEHVELIDRYEGEQVGEGLCSQAFRLRYRHPDRTLTDEEVDGSHGAIRLALEKQMGAQLRC